MTGLGFVSMGVFILMLILAAIFGKGRECGERQALENAVCKECWDESCLSCPMKANECKKCAPGYFLTSYGECVKCDDEVAIQCLECSSQDDGKTLKCGKCNEGFRLDSADN